MREPAQQHWPWLKKIPKLTHEMASSMLASLKTMLGDLPPSSRVTFFRLDLAAACRMVRPTTVEPVKATLSMSMWEAMAAPAVLPKPERMLTTPAGIPAFSQRVAAYRPDRGVCSAVFKTTTLPVAKAGPIFHDHMRRGKFQGMI